MVMKTIESYWKRQRRLAKQDGLEGEYEYHLNLRGTEYALPYERWVIKYRLLNSIQSKDGYDSLPDNHHLVKLSDKLCDELGY